VIMKE